MQSDDQKEENARTVPRRDFLALTGLALAGSTLDALPVMAGPFVPSDFQGPIVADKRLYREWVDSLTERGQKSVYRGSELEKIGMPIGGIGAGQVYLGGDGRLWHWDIFNIPHGTGDANYAHPPSPESPLLQSFVLSVKQGGKSTVRSLERARTDENGAAGFSEIEFCGQYPVGTVKYSDKECPVSVTLDAFSPFIPLNADDSSLPVTVLRFTIQNSSRTSADVELTGSLENAICLQSRPSDAVRMNRIVHSSRLSCLELSVERRQAPAPPPRPDAVFENWRGTGYAGWTVEGAAFGSGPVLRAKAPAYQGDLGGEEDHVVNSHAAAPGATVQEKDGATGKLTSRKFTVDRNYLRFWIGGGAHKGRTCLNLVVDGKVVRTETGRDDNRMAQRAFDLRDLQGKEARIEIVDAESGPWGNIGVGRITLTDRATSVGRVEDLPDHGTMTLALLGNSAEIGAADRQRPSEAQATSPIYEKLIGSLGRHIALKPGQAGTVTFLITWHFPNLEIGGLGNVGRWYATKFPSALAVASYVSEHFDRLWSTTKLWRDTWYDSTLPHWFLDRTLLNVSTLATSACYRFANGRFYAWEGVGCCAGTCTHVWHYAHAMARLFPELERDTRERVDFGIGFNPDSGVIGFRAEFDRSLAVDGQAGTLLRAYREHQMSPDDSFLKRNWPKIKKAFDPLLALDGDADGVLEGPQMNTLDQPWFGKVAWLSSLYAAALRAGEAMSREMGETDFAERCLAIAERGARNIDSELFNGEYYQQLRDVTRAKTAGSYDGCEIDQVLGDSWARQVGLPAVLPQANVRTALQSLWKYNFLPDVGPFREAHKPGRVYATAGEAGLIMCSWPKGEGARVEQGFDFYFNECMTGFEYQAASHMLWEGLVTEGLAVTRAIHDRYHASRRNPWNEVECGDHYSRAMASYGVYVAACGLEVHGPRGHLGFSPRLSPEKFKAAFTIPQGWGSFSQTIRGGKRSVVIAAAHGQLRLKSLSLGSHGTQRPDAGVRATVNGRPVRLTSVSSETGHRISFEGELILVPGQKLAVVCS